MREYYVIAVSSEDYRFIDDGGEPILYPKNLFDVVDCSIPPGWQFDEDLEEGEYYLEPILLSQPGLYEDFFCSDGDVEAAARSRLLHRQVLEAALQTASEEDRLVIERDLARMLGETSHHGE